MAKMELEPPAVETQSQTSPTPHPLSVRPFSHLPRSYSQCAIPHLSIENLLTQTPYLYHFPSAPVVHFLPD